LAYVGHVYPCPHNVSQTGTGILERPLDDLETAPGLGISIPDTNDLAVLTNGRSTGDRNVRANPNRAAIADYRFPGGPGVDIQSITHIISL
jgi:hypothetical protein